MFLLFILIYVTVLLLCDIETYPLGPNEIEIVNHQLSVEDSPSIECGNKFVKILSLKYGNKPSGEEPERNFCYAPDWYINQNHCINDQLIQVL